MNMLLELSRKPEEGDVLIYSNGKIKPVKLNVLLSEVLNNLVVHSRDINELFNMIKLASKEIKNLKGEE